MPANQLTMKLIYVSCIYVFGALTALASDAESLAGKWSVTKTNEQGQVFNQSIEVKKDKFIFEILSAEKQVVIHAEGDIKFGKLGPFTSVHFTKIRGGQSPSDLQDIDDEYTSIYTLDSDSWIMAANFDKERPGQKPALDNYKRVKAVDKAGETKSK
jgi:hypothetical protein